MKVKNCKYCGIELNQDNCSTLICKGVLYFRLDRKQCRNIKSGEKYKNNESYREYRKNKSAEYLIKNKDNILKYQKEYYNDNKEKVLNNVLEYRYKNVEKLKIKKQNYFKSEIGRLVLKINGQKRRHSIRGSKDKTINKNSLINMLETQKYKCNITGESLYIDGILTFHIDHIMPLSKGGTHSIDNIQLVIPDYNLTKHNKMNFTKEQYYATKIKKAFYFGQKSLPINSD